MELTEGYVVQENDIMKLEYNDHYNDWKCSECNHRNFPSHEQCVNCGVEPTEDAPYLLTDRNTVISHELCIRGIPPTCTEQDIHESLSLTNEKLTNIKIVRDHKTRHSKMYGFLSFSSREEAYQVYAGILSKGLFITNTPISVAFAKSKDEAMGDDEKKWKEQFGLKKEEVDEQKEDQLPTCDEHVHYYRTQKSLMYYDGNPYFKYDTTSRYFYNPYTKMHYDKRSGYYYDTLTQQWMYYDTQKNVYHSLQSATNKLEEQFKAIDECVSDDEEEEEEEGFFGYAKKQNIVTKLNEKEDLIEKVIYIEPTVEKVLPAKNIESTIIRKASTVSEEKIQKRKRLALEHYKALQPKKVSNKQKLVHAKPLPPTHIGYKALLSMGWKHGEALGKHGHTEPLPILTTYKQEGIGYNSKSVSIEHAQSENDNYQERGKKKLATTFFESTT
mmetsp:Transcript_8813/g.13068  ORF Transcript_8813/g.13068 Transcript_8813/m.13068 type:complete len:443 (+) Transcript_8813:185-1513(+)